MDHTSFDRITRLLGGAATRRAGIGAVVASLASAAIAGDIAANGGKVKPEGPCGNGRRKDNICTKDSDCCTNICNVAAGKTNMDEKGRCRCVRRNGACTADKNCCGTMTCNANICGSSVPEVCVVCASGCAYTTIGAAVAALPANSIVTIDNGTYTETITVDKAITLQNCNGSAPVMKNSASGDQTIYVSMTTDSETLTIDSVAITRTETGSSYGGGIQAFKGSLTLTGTTHVYDIYGGYGAVSMAAGGNLTLSGSAIIENSTSASLGGGGVHMPGASMTMTDNSIIRNNTAPAGKGGGVWLVCPLTMSGNAQITGNTVGDGVYGSGSASLSVTAPASITGNTPNNCAGTVSC